MLAIIFSLISLLPSKSSAASLATEIHQQDTVRQPASTSSKEKGHFVQINRIFITGNRLTREKIILRELSVKPGDAIFTEDLTGILELDKKKLINTRLFNTVEIKVLELEPLKADLHIAVNERWYTFPVPLFELSDRNFNEWWQNYDHDLKRINYGLRLYRFNMRGRNETLRLHVQSGFQQRYELMYRFPYIDKKQKHGITIEANFVESKNPNYSTVDHKYEFVKSRSVLRDDRFISFVYNYRNSFYQNHSVEIRFRTTRIGDTLEILNENIIPGDAKKLDHNLISYQFNSDHRDFISYPLRGNQVLVLVSKTGLGLNDDVNKFEVNATYSKYTDLKNGYYLSNSLTGYWSTPKNDLPYINYGVLGLKKQFVRGYEVYVIEGPQYFLNKSTFKKLLFSRKYYWRAMPIEQFRHIPLSVYLKSYADMGYVTNYPYYEQRNLNTRLSDRLLAGAGMGIDVVASYDSVIRFEYTFTREGTHGFFFHLKREF